MTLLRTSDPDIFAIGEVALHRGMIYGLVAPGYEMADVRRGEPGRRRARLHRLRHVHQAQAHGRGRRQLRRHLRPSASAPALTYEDPFRGVYKKLLFNADGTRLGRRHSGRRRVRLWHAARPLQERRPLARGAGRAAAGTAGRQRRCGAGCGSDGAQVCSCNNVSEGQIRDGHPRRSSSPRSPRSSRAPRPAPAAAVVCRRSPICSRPS